MAGPTGASSQLGFAAKAELTRRAGWNGSDHPPANRATATFPNLRASCESVGECAYVPVREGGDPRFELPQLQQSLA